MPFALIQGDRGVYLFVYDGRGVSVWTDLVDGRQVCVGVEIQPMSDDLRDRTIERAEEWTEEKIETPEAVQGQPLPITRVWLQGVPLGAMMAKAARTRQERLAAPVGLSAAGVPIPHGVLLQEGAFIDEHMRRVARAYDAVAYVARVRAGSASPARDIAEESGQSVASVRSRIAEARKLGLLTSAGAGITGGALTDEAVSTLRHLYYVFPTKWLRETARAAGLELDAEETD
jgi:hypothetical protein